MTRVVIPDSPAMRALTERIVADPAMLRGATIQPATSALETLREHLLGVVQSVQAIEVDVGFELPMPEQIAHASLEQLRSIAQKLSIGVCEVLR